MRLHLRYLHIYYWPKWMVNFKSYTHNMSSQSNLRRNSLRMEGYDYSMAGAYFITTVTYQRSCIFGDIEDGEMELNVFGQIIKQTWEWLSSHYEYVELDTFIVMPNHFHGIIKIIVQDDPGRGGSATRPS